MPSEPSLNTLPARTLAPPFYFLHVSSFSIFHPLYKFVDESTNLCMRSYLCERAYGTLCAGGITVFRNECAAAYCAGGQVLLYLSY